MSSHLNDHSEGREWFAGTYSDTVIEAFTNDSLRAVFEFKKKAYDYMDYTVCPNEKWPGGVELTYTSDVYDESLHFKVFNFHERTEVEIGVTYKGFAFFSFYPDELKLYIWDDFRGNHVRFVGDTVVRGKNYTDIYRINLPDKPDETGGLRSLLFSKSSGVIEYGSASRNTWIMQ